MGEREREKQREQRGKRLEAGRLLDVLPRAKVPVFQEG